MTQNPDRSDSLSRALDASPVLAGLGVIVCGRAEAASDASVVGEAERVVQAILAGDYEDITDLGD